MPAREKLNDDAGRAGLKGHLLQNNNDERSLQPGLRNGLEHILMEARARTRTPLLRRVAWYATPGRD